MDIVRQYDALAKNSAFIEFQKKLKENSDPSVKAAVQSFNVDAWIKAFNADQSAKGAVMTAVAPASWSTVKSLIDQMKDVYKAIQFPEEIKDNMTLVLYVDFLQDFFNKHSKSKELLANMTRQSAKKIEAMKEQYTRMRKSLEEHIEVLSEHLTKSKIKIHLLAKENKKLKEQLARQQKPETSFKVKGVTFKDDHVTLTKKSDSKSLSDDEGDKEEDDDNIDETELDPSTLIGFGLDDEDDTTSQLNTTPFDMSLLTGKFQQAMTPRVEVTPSNPDQTRFNADFLEKLKKQYHL